MKKLFALLTCGLLVSALLAGGCGSRKTAGGEINIVQTNPPAMLEMLKNKEIDGFIAWEPFNAQAVLSGDGRYLVQSSEIWPEHSCCLLAVNPESVDEDTAKVLAWANIRAAEFINNPANREQVIAYAMEFSGKDREAIEESLKNIQYADYPSEEQVRAYYDDLKAGGMLKPSEGFDEEKFFQEYLNRSYWAEMKEKLSGEAGFVPGAVPADKKLVLGYLNQDLHELAVYIALKEGYYRQAGLIEGSNLEIKVFSNGPAAMAAFKNKEVDASYLGGAPAMLKSINDDVKISVIGGANNVGSAIVVGKDSGIGDIKELQGRTIAVPGLGTVQYFILDKAAKLNGLTLKVK